MHPIAALQTEYSLWTRDPEDEILATCRELGIGFVAYSPLGPRLPDRAVKRLEDFAPDDYRRNSRASRARTSKEPGPGDKVEEMAQEKGCTPGQLALAWVLAQGEDIVPIPGTKRRKYLEENAAALDVKLTPEDLRRMRCLPARRRGRPTLHRPDDEGCESVGKWNCTRDQ